MKKTISIIISLVMLFSVFTLCASAEENYCHLFEKQWSHFTAIESYGDESTPWSADTIAYITAMNFDYEKYLNSKKSTDTDTYFSIPAAEFESLAKKLFDVKVNLKRANYDDICGVKYDAAANAYDLILYSHGGGALYEIYGYSKLGDTYTVYLKNAAQGEDNAVYAKATATCDGQYAKLISFEKVTRLPAQNTLINPTTKFPSASSDIASSEETSSDSNFQSSLPSSTDSSAAQSSTSSDTLTNAPISVIANKYDVSLSASKGVFPENAVVTISKITDSEKLNTIKSTIGDGYSKFVAFDFSATENGTAIQPKGTVTASFKLPSDYNVDNVTILRISDSDEVESIQTMVNKGSRTISAELSHFSIFLIAESITENDINNTNDSNSTVVILIVIIVLIILLGGAAAWYFLIFKRNIKFFKN